MAAARDDSRDAHVGRLVGLNDRYTYTLNLFKEVQQGSYRLGCVGGRLEDRLLG